MNFEKSKKKEEIERIVGKKIKGSQIFHLKAIEMGCKFIQSKCPYINHLITSYHKHFNLNLETIVIKIVLF